MTSDLYSFVHLLRQRAADQPQQQIYRFLSDGENEEASLSYGELDLRARAIAARLQIEGVAGDRVLLVYPAGLEYIAAFFGCLYAGMIAVPIYPPRPNRTLERFESIVADADAKFALTTDAVFSRNAASPASEVNGSALRWLATDKIANNQATEWQQPSIDASTLAYLQYTSGSTSLPKGVMVSHGNLLYNSADMDHGWQHTRDSVIVSWLPHFHDMGLIYGILQPLFKGVRSILMPPVAFLQQPARWLQAITRYRGTHSAAPNFAYELCIRKVTPEQRASLDLSSWVVAVNGAEPVRRETLDRFSETFASCGFRSRTFCPGYGLAEATLKVVATTQASSPVYYSVDSDALAQHRIVEVSPAQRDAQTFVGCGQAMLETKIAIVNPETLQATAAGEVGEIWVSGPTVAKGYWRRPEETARDFQARLPGSNETYLRTGDLGFTKDGELFITGRLKDLIIIRGRNHYPQDIELTAERSHPALRSGCGAAFSVDENGTESLVVVHEIERNVADEDFEKVFGAIRKALASEHELHAYGVVLIKTGSLPKTSSGKVQRRAARAAFLAGILDTIAVSCISESQDAAREHHLDRESLLAMAPATRNSALSGYLLEQLAQRLGVQPRSLNHQQPLGTFGLDSLMALELRNSIETDLQVSISPSKLLGDENVDQLAAELLDQLAKQTSVAHIRTSTDDEHPLSYGQRALWFMHNLDPDSPSYNVMYAARIQPGIDIQSLERAWQALVDRHASLRTTYLTSNDGRPIQKIHAHVPAEIQETDATDWTAEKLSVRINQAAELPFSLERGPIARLQLFRQSNQDVLLLTVHHIACDFWSLDVLVAELRELYQRDESLPAPQSDYTDFVKWQAEMLSGPEGTVHSSYWLTQLSGELTTLNLPADHPNAAAQNRNGATEIFPLNKNLVDRLRTLARTEGTTLFTVLLAAFQVLLHRYTGQQEILVGAPTAGRSRVEFTDVVGYFVNPVVLRAHLSGNPTFEVFLAQVRRTVLSALEHQDYPFPLLTERLQPVRDPGRTPLFQVTFAWDKLQRLEHETDTAWETVFWKQGGAPFHLMMNILESSKSLDVNLHYNADLFDRATISRLATHFQTVLESIAAQPAQRILDLPLLSEPERHQLLSVWNDTAADFDSSVLAHQLFEAQAERSPGAPALVFGNTSVSHSELNARANRLARYLKARGVGPETRVAICMERTPDAVVGILGILKAGGAYVPMDPSYPAERLAFMLDDAHAHVLITSARLARELPEVAANVICLDRDEEAINSEDSANLDTNTSAANLAYVIYTSGSTGRPKGVQITHAALLNLVKWHQRTFDVTPADVATHLAGAGFDASVWELWPYLTAGASLHLVDDETRTSPERLLNYLVTKEITISFLPTPLAESVLALEWPASCALRVMLTGGDKLHRYPARPKPFVLVNNYGPTENTVVATSGPVSCGDVSPSIGRPIANVEVYLLDACLNPVAIGAPGELYIGGASLTRGYLNRPELTAEKLIPHPFSKERGARLYRSGDLARYRTDGQIEFLGRVDQQVKIRGFRIELEEIEAVLAEHASVQEAVVLAREDVPGEKRLVAYVVFNNESASSELRAYLKQTLPDYMIPTAFVSLNALPLNPSGKIDRRALPAPDAARSEELIAPRTSVEEVLVKIWRDVLEVEQIGVEDNFFELGGHSLLMAQVMSRVHDTLQLEIPLRTLLEAPTVSGLAEAVEITARAEQVDAEKIAQLWLMIEQLSPAEIETALHQEDALISLH